MYPKGPDSHICLERTDFIYETFHHHSGLPYKMVLKATNFSFKKKDILSIPNIIPGSVRCQDFYPMVNKKTNLDCLELFIVSFICIWDIFWFTLIHVTSFIAYFEKYHVLYFNLSFKRRYIYIIGWLIMNNRKH